MSEKISNTDRAAIVRDAWSRAYVAAIAAAEPVRLHLGAAFREAWTAFRQDRAEGRQRVTMTADYEDRYGRSDRAMARQHLGRLLAEKAAAAPAPVEPAPAMDTRQALVDRIARNDVMLSEQRAEVNRWWAMNHAEPPEHMFKRMDDTHAFGIELRDELAGMETAQPVVPVQLDLVTWLATAPSMVPQQAQQQQANAGVPAPDMTTAEGLAEVLVGRTAKLTLQSGEADYAVTAVTRWTSPDGSRVRDYIALETTGRWSDERKGPTGLHIERVGGGRGAHGQTRAGTARWSYGVHCESGNKRHNADALVRDLLAPILDD